RAAAPRPVTANRSEVEAAEGLLSSYISARSENLSALKTVAAELTRLAPDRVALWGAGRLFDALVTHGKFEPRVLVALIDTHLKNYVETRHGVALQGPEALMTANPGIIVIMSRAFAGEIARLAAAAVPHAEIVFYTELLDRARNRLAA